MLPLIYVLNKLGIGIFIDATNSNLLTSHLKFISRRENHSHSEGGEVLQYSSEIHRYAIIILCNPGRMVLNK